MFGPKTSLMLLAFASLSTSVVLRAQAIHPDADPRIEKLVASVSQQRLQAIATKLAGLTKLMLAEANNFPELAQFYNEEVVTRGNALIVSLLERGMQRGEFRQVDAVLVSTILSAPVTMLMMWTHSYLPCEVKNIDPLAYMDAFIDMSVRSLQVEAPGKS